MLISPILIRSGLSSAPNAEKTLSGVSLTPAASLAIKTQRGCTVMDTILIDVSTHVLLVAAWKDTTQIASINNKPVYSTFALIELYFIKL